MLDHRDMTKLVRDYISFVTMAVLVFIGSHFLLFNYASTGPNVDLSLGWLELHRHGDSWSVEQFRFGFLASVVFFSVALTWVLSKVFRRRVASRPKD